MRRWRPGVKMTVAVLLLFPLTISLGLWQVDRAAEKRGYQDRYFDRVGRLPVAAPADLQDAAFLRVGLTGRFEPERYFLVDNQVNRGRVGYWVVASFLAEDGRRWLVNRGWTAAAEQRSELPRVTAPPGVVSILVVLWPETGLPPLLAQDPWPMGWPKRVQRLDVVLMAAELDNAEAVQARLEEGQPGALEPPSFGAEFSPESHTGYAVQWFGLAAALIAAFVAFGFRRHKDD